MQGRFILSGYRVVRYLRRKNPKVPRVRMSIRVYRITAIAGEHKRPTRLPTPTILNIAFFILGLLKGCPVKTQKHLKEKRLLRRKPSLSQMLTRKNKKHLGESSSETLSQVFKPAYAKWDKYSSEFVGQRPLFQLGPRFVLSARGSTLCVALLGLALTEYEAEDVVERIVAKHRWLKEGRLLSKGKWAGDHRLCLFSMVFFLKVAIPLLSPAFPLMIIVYICRRLLFP